jgi:threonine aldolase
MPKQFLTMVKMRGGLLAKGRVLGIQFDTLFTDNLYFDISKHAIEMADILKAGLKAKNIPFFIDSPTNQIFVILEDSKKIELEKKVVFSFWEKYDDTHTVTRKCGLCGWEKTYQYESCTSNGASKNPKCTICGQGLGGLFN